ncbi:MAG: type II toxin-antitoxin system RelE/ParE family toxin [Roseiflexaceae bacterium]
MTPNELAAPPARDVRFTPEFKRNLRQLAKKYRRIRSDIQPLIDALIAGELPGDQIQGIGFSVYKVRVRNSDAQRGKRGGYRMIYYLPTNSSIVLITLYSKTEQQDIEPHEIQAILQEDADITAIQGDIPDSLV